MAKPGPKTNLDKELLRKIKECILNGESLVNTAKICEIPESTLYTWHSDNYLKLADLVEGWKRDRKLMLAEANLEEFLTMSDLQESTYVNKKGTTRITKGRDSQLTRVKADISKFVSETLGKKSYSKQLNTDLTSGGEPLYLPSEIIDKYDTSSESK